VLLENMAREEKTCAPERCKRDWAGDLATLVLAWGLPSATMFVALLLEPLVRTAIWTAMLTWMGVACIANARQCGRTHCYYTGPFFLLMVVVVLAHANAIVPLGSHGWAIIALITIAGVIVLWWGSERLLGTFHRRK
jgi:hypothetical protein